MTEHLRPADPDLLRGLTSARMNRRDAVRLAGLAGAGLALTACGVQGKAKAQPSGQAINAAVKSYWAGKTQHGHVDFANWPLYMDPKHPQLQQFTKQTGITVNYQEVILEDNTWFAKVQPQLAAGQSIGYDLMVVTNGIEFTEFVQLGYLAPLDHSRLRNFAANAGAVYKNESFDTGNVYSIPWASGMTGIGYNPKYVTTPPTRIADLWDPKYKGKVGMMSDTQEVGNFGILLDGVNPEKSTVQDWQKAGARLKAQRDAGIVRQYYDQAYIKPLTNGDIWLTMAWSGDIFQQNVSEGTNLKFVIPEEGGTIWTDNMMIPKTAKNPVDAIELMDFFYRPDIAAQVAEYINYVTPVPSCQNVIQQDAAKASGSDQQSLQQVATSPLVFPSTADYAKLHHYRMFKSDAEKQKYLSIFQPIINA